MKIYPSDLFAEARPKDARYKILKIRIDVYREDTSIKSNIDGLSGKWASSKKRIYHKEFSKGNFADVIKLSEFEKFIQYYDEIKITILEYGQMLWNSQIITHRLFEDEKTFNMILVPEKEFNEIYKGWLKGSDE